MNRISTGIVGFAIGFAIGWMVQPAFAQSAITLPIAANAVADLGNGPVKVRMIAGNASIFTVQGSGVGSTSGSSTALTLTGTPATPPIVGGLISGAGITSGTTVTAYNGTTGITLSAAMTVAGGTAVAWGAACPSIPPSNVIQASPQADYFVMYTQARVCAVSPGGPVNTLLIEPIFYDQGTAAPGTPGGSSGQVQTNNGSGGFNGLTNAQLTALCNIFTSSLSGCAPSSGGGATNFLRADGSWTAPPGGGDVTGPPSSVDRDIPIFNGITGKAIIDSGVNFPAFIVSGGVLYGASSSSLASSGDLALNGVLLGGGPGGAPTTATGLGTNGQIFLGVTGGAPNWATMSGACTVTNAGVMSCSAVTLVTCNGGLTGGAITTTGTCAVDIATNSNIWGGTANKLIDAAGNVSSQVPQPLTISTATFTPDFSVGINFDIVLINASCPCTVANPVNIHQNTYFLTVVQSGTGSDLIGTWGSFYKFPGGVAPTLSTGAGAVDILPVTCRNTPGSGIATINYCMVGAIQQAFQ